MPKVSQFPDAEVQVKLCGELAIRYHERSLDIPDRKIIVIKSREGRHEEAKQAVLKHGGRIRHSFPDLNYIGCEMSLDRVVDLAMYEFVSEMLLDQGGRLAT